jgi:CubicO group peptidase (beta-lactamase class C family)
MNKFTAVVILILVLSKSLLADNISDKLDEMLNKYNEKELFSGVVVLAKDGDVIYKKTSGYADWENKIPVNFETHFNIASIGKMFTATLIKQLEKEGKLSMNDPLNKYLNIFSDEIGSKITIQLLLDMKAGLGDYFMDPAYRRNVEKFTTVDAYLNLIKDEPLLYQPGQGQEYSNSGYAVLGGVIEKVTGKSYEQNLKERIFEPLGMNNSFYKQMNDKIDNFATATNINFAGNKKRMREEASPSPAGGFYMNAGDLFKMDAYLKSTKLLSGGVRAGGTPGWNSIFGQYKNGYTLIILSNFGRVADEMEMKFRKIMLNEPYGEPALPMQMVLYKTFKEEGSMGLSKNLKKILEENDMQYSDMALNNFGYQLMEAGELDMAIEVFKLNTELFPNIANTFDSLAEAYTNKGNKELAIANYKKVLELRPQNENAKKMIEKLSK